MARKKTKIALFAAAAIVLVIFIVGRNSGHARMKLPVGQGTPAISLGQTHGVILASDGSLWSWGSDFLGWPVLGLGNVSSQTRLRRIGTETNWTSISSSEVHNLAIKSDGTIWAWGENLYGQFGLGTVAWSPAMTNIPILAAPGHDWKQAAAGGYFSVALKSDGTLWAWGDNWAGPLGIGSTNNSAVPVQIGVATNWTRVWAGILETVGMQSDGSLWYWGENPNPASPQGAGQILVPTRVSPDTNWVDVGFGDNTVFAIKSDGTLWSWGRNAHVYTGVSDQDLDVTPVRVGTDNDWRSISASGWWWCQGLVKKDGSLWLMDASDSKPNGPRSPYRPVRFRRVELPQGILIAAYTAGAVHAAAPGYHVPMGAALTRDGEVWTWGMVLGDPPTPGSGFRAVAGRLAKALHLKIQFGDPNPVVREKPWRLPNDEPNDVK